MNRLTSTSVNNYWVAVPLWGLFVISLIAALYLAQTVLIPITLAILFALILSPVSRTLQSWHIPRAVAALLIVGVFMGSLASLTNYLIDPVSEWVEHIPDSTQTLERKLQNLKSSLEEMRTTTETLDDMADVTSGEDNKQQVVIQQPGLGRILFDSTQAFLVGLLSFTVLLYFLLAYGDSLLLSLGKMSNRKIPGMRILRITESIRCDVSQYLFTITLINIGLGIATTLAMYWLDMPTPILWGTLAAILNYIPYAGPFLNISLITLVSMLTFDSIPQMWPAPLAAFCLNLLEGQLIQPMLIGHRFRLNPGLVFISILLWGWLWGVTGVLIAIPVLMIANSIMNESKQDRNKQPISALTASSL